jgi:hypothetical protein
MVNISQFTVAPHRFAPWIACLWQGPPPEGVTLHCYVHLADSPDGARRMLVVWDGADERGAAAFERSFAEFGTFETEHGRIATPGLAAALARDLDGFRDILAARAQPPEEIERALDLRRRGHDAATHAAAVAAGEAWAHAVSPGA